MAASPRRFAFRPIPLIATVLLVILGIVLGNWQSGRAAEKLALQQKLADAAKEAPVLLDPRLPPAQLEFRKVRLTGHFIDWPIALNNRPYKGQPGFYLVMPFKLDDAATHVLVARGWLPRNIADPTRLPAYRTPPGTVTIDGVVKTGLGHIMQLGTAPPLTRGAIVQNLTPAQFAAASGVSTAPLFVEQAAGTDDGLVRDWPAPALGVEKHQGYAFQWYALAVMAALFFIVTGFRRGTTQQQ